MQTILGATNYLGIDGFLTGNTGTFTNISFNGNGMTGPNKLILGLKSNGSCSAIGTDVNNNSTQYYGFQHNLYVGTNVTLDPPSGVLSTNLTTSANYGSLVTVYGNLGITGSSAGSLTSGNLDVGNNLYVTGTAGGSTAWASPSDYRIKKDVQNLDNLYTIDKLRPVSYYNTLSNKNDVGLIAHELQDVYPFMVMGIKDGPTNQSVNYTSLIGILIKEIQRLKERVDILENK